MIAARRSEVDRHVSRVAARGVGGDFTPVGALALAKSCGGCS